MLGTLKSLRQAVGDTIDLPKWPRNGDGTSVN
jgi:hypothetical protein